MWKKRINHIQNLFVINNYCQDLITVMDLSSEQKYFLYLLRIELLSCPEK